MIGIAGIGLFRILWILCALVCVACLFYVSQSSDADRETSSYKWYKSIALWVVLPIGIVSLLLDLYLSGQSRTAQGLMAAGVGIYAIKKTSNAASGLKSKVTALPKRAWTGVKGLFGK